MNQEVQNQKDVMRKRLVAFTVSVIKLAGQYEHNRTLAPVFNQIIRSAGSIGANISEASGSITKKGFVHYFHIALQSANETRYWLDVLRGTQQLLTAEGLDEMQEETSEFIRIITASLRTMKQDKEV